MAKKLRVMLKNKRAVSQLLAAIILIAIVLVASVVLLVAFRNILNRATGNTVAEITNVTLHANSEGDYAIFTITLKNTGDKPLVNITLGMVGEPNPTLYDLSQSPLMPGQTRGFQWTPTATYHIGDTYAFAVEATALDGASFTYSNTLLCEETTAPGNRYTLTIVATENGAFDPSAGTRSYYAGDMAQVEAFPETGYRLGYWVLDGSNVGASSQLQILMRGNHTVTAVFVTSTATVTFSSTGQSLASEQIVNGGFETGDFTGWGFISNWGSEVQTSEKHSGNYSASLLVVTTIYQYLATPVPTEDITSFTLWYKKDAEAWAQVEVDYTDDTTLYLDLGVSGVWTQADLKDVLAVGNTVRDIVVAKGYYVIHDNNFYLDDVSLVCTAEQSNLGTIKVDSSSITIPQSIPLSVGSHSVEFVSAIGYSFDHWEVTGGVVADSPNANPTSITVTGDGTVTAVFVASTATVTFSSEGTERMTNGGFNDPVDWRGWERDPESEWFFGYSFYDGTLAAMNTFHTPNPVPPSSISQTLATPTTVSDVITFHFHAAAVYQAYIGSIEPYPIHVRFDYTDSTYNIVVKNIPTMDTFYEIELKNDLLSGKTLSKVTLLNDYSTVVTLTLDDWTLSVYNNLGTIKVDSAAKSLPQEIALSMGSHSVEFVSPTGYSFGHWEVTGGVVADSPNANPTSITVTGDGTVTAVFVPSAATVTFSSTGQSLNSERIVNGGFETGDFTGWYEAQASITDSKSHSGTYSAALYECYLGQELDITKELIDDFGFWAIGSPYNSFTIFYSDSTSGWYGVDFLLPRINDYTWSYIDCLALVPDGKTIEEIYFEGGTGNFWWIDDVSLVCRAEQSNLGTIKVDSSDIGILPQAIVLSRASHSVEFVSPTGYSFGHWEVTGGVAVAYPNANPTSITVTGDGTVTAVFTAVPYSSPPSWNLFTEEWNNLSAWTLMGYTGIEINPPGNLHVLGEAETWGGVSKNGISLLPAEYTIEFTMTVNYWFSGLVEFYWSDVNYAYNVVFSPDYLYTDYIGQLSGLASVNLTDGAQHTWRFVVRSGQVDIFMDGAFITRCDPTCAVASGSDSIIQFYGEYGCPDFSSDYLRIASGNYPYYP